MHRSRGDSFRIQNSGDSVEIVFIQFLTRISTSDWFLDVLKIRTEYSSRVPLQWQVAL